tara:strand:- start:5866 stop:6054 length:189 start_codon:yes stop_codon:yes gene_type:complete
MDIQQLPPEMGIGGITLAMKLKMAAIVLRSRLVKSGKITIRLIIVEHMRTMRSRAARTARMW